MNKINPKKLLNSKWTALNPVNKEKHFIVSRVEFDDQDTVMNCHIEAVLTGRIESIDWQNLRDCRFWRHGWL